MESLIETFHLDWRLFLAQVVNFAIVFAVLYWFAFKPLAKIMSERSGKIGKSLADAKKIEEKLVETKQDYNRELAEAKKQANLILEKAGREADARKAEMVARAKEEIGQIINQEKQKMQVEKARTLKEIKKEVVELVVAVAEKVLGKKVDKKEDVELIKRMIKN